MIGNSARQHRVDRSREFRHTLFQALLEAFGEDALIELTAAIAWENASSKFNRALRVESQQLWPGEDAGRA